MSLSIYIISLLSLRASIHSIQPELVEFRVNRQFYIVGKTPKISHFVSLHSINHATLLQNQREPQYLVIAMRVEVLVPMKTFLFENYIIKFFCLRIIKIQNIKIVN